MAAVVLPHIRFDRALEFLDWRPAEMKKPAAFAVETKDGADAAPRAPRAFAAEAVKDLPAQCRVDRRSRPRSRIRGRTDRSDELAWADRLGDGRAADLWRWAWLRTN